MGNREIWNQDLLICSLILLCLFLSLSDTCIIINKEISRQNNWYSPLDSTIIKKAMIFKSTQGNRFVVILTKHVNVLK